MDKELLMLYGARNAVIKILNNGGKWFAKTVENDDIQTVEYADICNYLTEMIDKRNTESEEYVNFADDLIPIMNEAESEEE